MSALDTFMQEFADSNVEPSIEDRLIAAEDAALRELDDRPMYASTASRMRAQAVRESLECQGDVQIRIPLAYFNYSNKSNQKDELSAFETALRILEGAASEDDPKASEKEVVKCKIESLIHEVCSNHDRDSVMLDDLLDPTGAFVLGIVAQFERAQFSTALRAFLSLTGNAVREWCKAGELSIEDATLIDVAFEFFYAGKWSTKRTIRNTLLLYPLDQSGKRFQEQSVVSYLEDQGIYAALKNKPRTLPVPR